MHPFSLFQICILSSPILSFSSSFYPAFPFALLCLYSSIFICSHLYFCSSIISFSSALYPLHLLSFSSECDHPPFLSVASVFHPSIFIHSHHYFNPSSFVHVVILPPFSLILLSILPASTHTYILLCILSIHFHAFSSVI